MSNTQTQNWKAVIKERMESYNKKVSDITSTLNKVVTEFTVAPYNIRTESKQLDNLEKLTWEVKIGKRTQLFYIDNFEYTHHPRTGKVDTLEERIQIAILDKFKFELK
jgi:hypothetical protein